MYEDFYVHLTTHVFIFGSFNILFILRGNIIKNRFAKKNVWNLYWNVCKNDFNSYAKYYMEMHLLSLLMLSIKIIIKNILHRMPKAWCSTLRRQFFFLHALHCNMIHLMHQRRLSTTVVGFGIYLTWGILIKQRSN